MKRCGRDEDEEESHTGDQVGDEDCATDISMRS